MTLLYEAGTASSQVDLLSKLKTFLVTNNGWVEEDWYDSSYSYAYTGDVESVGKVLVVSKTDSYGEKVYFSFYACYHAFAFNNPSSVHGATTFNDLVGPTEDIVYKTWVGKRSQCSGIAVIPHRSINSGAVAWWDQGGVPRADHVVSYNGWGCYLPHFLGQITNYWFFAQGDSIHIVSECFPGEFDHLSFGTLIKSHPYTGGQYLASSANHREPMIIDSYGSLGGRPWHGHDDSDTYRRESGYFYAEVNTGETGYDPWGRMQDDTPDILVEGECTVGIPDYNNSTGVDQKPFAMMALSMPNSLSGITAQFPLYVRRSDPIKSSYVIMGYPEGIRFTNMKSLNSKAETTYGADIWKVFPTYIVDSSLAYYQFCVPGLTYKKN